MAVPADQKPMPPSQRYLNGSTGEVTEGEKEPMRNDIIRLACAT